MDTKPRSVCLVGFVSALLLANSATVLAQGQPGQAQAEPQNAASSVAQPPTAPPASMPPASQLSATQPAAAPGAPPPAAYYPPPYYPPPGYFQPPGYAPPPGYASPPGYYPPPGYGPVYYPPKDQGPPSGFHQHDGFYMRLTAGVGYLNAKSGDSSTYLHVSGGGPAMSFAFGGSVTPHLVLFGELMLSSAMDPKADGAINSQSLSYGVNMSGIGPGLAYYLEPSNIYFSATLAFSQVSASSPSNSDSSYTAYADRSWTHMGVGASFMAGKEWWVSHDWGLGVAGQFRAAWMKAKAEFAGSDDTMSATAFSILFSASYN